VSTPLFEDNDRREIDISQSTLRYRFDLEARRLEADAVGWETLMIRCANRACSRQTSIGERHWTSRAGSSA
jgi:hypothetical protein